MYVCVCVCVCVYVCRRTQSLNQLTDLIQIRHLGSSCKYLEPFFSFPPTLKIKGSSHKKKKLISIFSKMALTIMFKFCGFIVHSKPNNMTQSAIPGKSLKLEKQFLIFFPSPRLATKPTHSSCSNSVLRVPLQISPAFFFSFLFRPTIKIKGSLLKKQANELGDKHGILQTCSILFLLLCY